VYYEIEDGLFILYLNKLNQDNALSFVNVTLCTHKKYLLLPLNILIQKIY
jgi:hypothetical protein